MSNLDEHSYLSDDAATNLHIAVMELFRCLRMTRNPDGLGMSKLGMLGFLHRGGPATAAEMAAYLRLQPQSMTRLLADLEERGLIAREPDSVDRRRTRIAITPPGTKLLATDVQDQRKQLAQAMKTVLTPTEQDLLSLASGLMRRVARSFKSSANPSEGPNE